MSDSKYSFAKLRRHTECIRHEAAPLLAEHFGDIEKAFTDFSAFLTEIDRIEDTLERNVRNILACKFLNHVYSSFILTESGLTSDAILCKRNALETLAFHWLVCLDRSALTQYNVGDIPRPVAVRKRLQQLGADISHIQDLYAQDSAISHVGRSSERFLSKWRSASDGILLFGGAFSATDQSEMFRFLPVMLYLFMKPMMVIG
jgi:hypothetical protein